MNLLHWLAEHDRVLEAPVGVEARVMAAFRRRNRLRRLRRAAAGGAVIAAGLLPLFLTPWKDSLLEIHVAPAGVPVLEVRRPLAATAPLRTRTNARLPREVVTEFFPLMDPAPPFERGQLLRVEVPASAMRTVGLPVREESLQDRVQADVLIGEEGMPRAIRFVSFDSK